MTSPAAEEEPLFEASHPFAFFDYFRIPYEVRPLQLRMATQARRLSCAC